MFTPQDLSQITQRQISLDIVEAQIRNFTEGFPFLELTRPATIGDGITQLSDNEIDEALAAYEQAVPRMRIVKFVPASGAATRMFKDLFAYMDTGKENAAITTFFEGIQRFSFYEALSEALTKDGHDIAMATKETVLAYLLTPKGLNYGNLPKGLLLFHNSENGFRTPMEEHIVEGAAYAKSGGEVNLHFTVSPEHKSHFIALLNGKAPGYSERHNLCFGIDFSEQKPATDTIAVTPDNQPFRETDGSLLFRPAGHGALLANLNDLDADLVFVKNIDNVVPDHLKNTTTIFKRAIGGVLVQTQKKIFEYTEILEKENVSHQSLDEISGFVQKNLCVEMPIQATLSEKVSYLLSKLRRPIRVCGMVKNVGEPGGGPFWVNHPDGSVQLQIIESAEVNLAASGQVACFQAATHFNPVDIACAWKDRHGKPYDLAGFRNNKAGFITEKSKDGRTLKAQELPGLWNGSMSNWNTIFVEVPLITFNPVKTVNDLLRPEHQPKQ